MSSTGSALRLYYFAFFTTMGLYLPFLPAWLEHFGLRGFEMSLVMSTVPLANVLAPSGFGLLADILQLRGSLLRYAASGALLALGTLAGALALGHPPTFLLVVVPFALFAFFRTPLQMMGEVIALEQTSDYGRIRLWGSIGFLLAATFGGHFLRLEPAWILPTWLFSSTGVLLLSTRWLPKKGAALPGPVLTQTRALLARSDFQVFLLCTVLAQASHAVCELCLSLRLRDLGVSSTWIGIAWAMSTGSEIALMAVSRRFLNSANVHNLLILAFGVAVGRWLLLASLTELSWILISQPLHAITFGLRWLCCMALVKRFGTPTTRATSQGLFLTAASIGMALGILCWGTAYEKWGSEFVFGGAAAVGVAATIGAVVLRQRHAALAVAG